MDSLKPSAFFSLDHYLHRELFSEEEPVWEALKRVESYLAEKLCAAILSPIPDGVVLVHPERIAIGEGCVIEPGAYLAGPCIIGPGSSVRRGAYIRGGVITGSRCVIGHATEIKRSILLDGVSAAHLNYVGDSILGSCVNLGAGAKCANVRLDRAPIAIAFQSQRVDTGLKKFGAILGDGVQIGCNAVTNPGTLMEPGSCCPPCAAVGGVVLRVDLDRSRQ